ncbi:hypothetical protein ACET3Z_003292 [Daucus carota]
MASPLNHLPDIQKETWRRTILLTVQSIGVVYGRLSIAPLYVFGSMRPKDIDSDERLYELFSFIFWTLTIVPLLKYAVIVLRADDNGEGGTFSLYSLLCRHAKVGLLPSDESSDEIMHYETGSTSPGKKNSRARRAIKNNKISHYMMLLLALFGSCMMIGDGVLTPALSVLSASKGLQLSLSKILEKSTSECGDLEKDLKKYVPVPAACFILVCLFSVQRYGTHKIGIIFAPVVIIWLFLISGVGLYNIVHWDHRILKAISPRYMFKFMKHSTIKSWKLLGNLVLCIAGSEAMFTDLGHFSKKSIKIAFVCLVYPALVLSYAGQAAFISKHLIPHDDEVVCVTQNASSEYFHLRESVPNHTGSSEVVRHFFVVLSLFAAAVGSQATITATFSIINQCQALSCFPRVKVVHTSNKIHGQVYIPDVNWLLMILSIACTIGFHEILPLGNATGFAIISGMLVTTCLMSLVILLYWERSWLLAASFLIFFGFVEIMYLSSSLLNFYKGAWCLVILLVFCMTIMLSWHYGTRKKYEFDLENKVPVDWLTDLSPGLGVSRVPGIGFIYTEVVTGIPAFFSHFITNVPAYHQVLIFVSFKLLPVPHISPSRRYLIGRVGPKEYKIYRCIVRYGYCDQVRDTDDFEDHIILSIGEFISREEEDVEALTSPERRMVVIGNQLMDENTIVSVPRGSDSETLSPPVDPSGSSCVTPNQKKVRFMLPPKSPAMRVSVRRELQELVDARESGTAYFLGQSHLSVQKRASFMKKFLITTYVLLDKNCRQPPVALNIPRAALLEVGMLYTI